MAKTTTPKFGLVQWSAGTDTLLRTDINSSFANIESRAVKETRGSLSSRPPFGQVGSYFVDTTTKIRYRDTGTAWERETIPASDIVGVLSLSKIPSIPWANVSGKPTTFAPTSHTHPVSQITGSINAATIGGRTIFVQSAAPTTASNGDIWFQV